MPIVGYKYAREIARGADVTLVTHVRNRENIEKAGYDVPVTYLDTEWLAGPMYKVERIVRGGDDIGWSTSKMFAYLPYVAFERAAWTRFRTELRSGAFDLVHRITPMTPTLPSYIAHKSPVPFLIGPMNGNLDWPAAFAAEQKRENETLRRFRDFYKYLPYARSTYDRAAAVLTAFSHTRRDLSRVEDARIVPFPEIGFDPSIFHGIGTLPAGRRSEDGKVHFLHAGRLVPYKLPELPIRAFGASEILRQHHLHIVGDGPELPRMQAAIAEEGLEACVTLHGRKTQTELADWMRRCDVFVHPSIRELGAGVVVEAMACGIEVMVTAYGAPGDLAAEGRGAMVEMADFDTLVAGFRREMEAVAEAPDRAAAVAARGQAYAETLYTWRAKGEKTLELYEAVLSGRPLSGLGY
nr:glycosyltransferase [Cognatishimia sp. F0-27]